jgi:hypothetical protein
MHHAVSPRVARSRNEPLKTRCLDHGEVKTPTALAWQRKEVVFGITALSARQAGPANLAGYAKKHWSVENIVHWPRYVIFGEDHQGAYVGNGPHCMAILRNLVLGLFRLARVRRSSA